MSLERDLIVHRRRREKTCASRYESGQRSHAAIRLADRVAAILLQEMPGALERRVELGVRQQLGDRLGGTPREDRVAVAEEDERRPVEGDAAPRARRASSAPMDGPTLVATSSGNCAMPTRDSGTGNGASYAAITSSVVGWTSERRTSCPATISSVDATHERLEAQPLLARRPRADAGVHDDEARDALGVLDGEAKADRAAPVLARRAVMSRRSSSAASRAIDSACRS